MADIELDGQSLTIEEAISVANGKNTAVLANSARSRMEESRNGVEKIIGNSISPSLVPVVVYVVIFIILQPPRYLVC